jgi:ribulose kinase
VAELADELRVLPDHHGNRSPRADASLRSMVCGLTLSDSLDSLALLYLATVQGLALGTRHILDALRAKGWRPTTLVACGGDTRNPLFVRTHADATGCRVVLPREPEAVLLGSAMLGAVAAGAHPGFAEAMAAMSGTGAEVSPVSGPGSRYYDRKYGVFLRMHADQVDYRRMMTA